MLKSSIICFIVGTLSVIAGITMAALSARAFSIGMSSAQVFALIFILSGCILLITGFIVGIFAAKISKLALSLNAASLSIFVLLFSIGMYMQWSATKERKDRLAAYTEQRESQRFQMASTYSELYHEQLRKHKIVLVNVESISNDTAPKTIAGYTFIPVLEISDGDAAGKRFFNQHTKSRDQALLTILSESGADMMNDIRSFYQGIGASLFMRVNGDFQNIIRHDVSGADVMRSLRENR